jgi:CxxC-x17-CxxC domain-containing protein
MPKDLTFIAKTNFRNKEQIFGIKRTDRRQHMYVIGKTGSGKTAFLKNMALQDIENGQGLAIIDPHGEFVEEVLDNIPPHRINDVVYFNPADMEFPVSFNIMDVADPQYKHLIASGLIGIFTKIWANVWSARMEYILANCILALLDTPGTTLLGIPRMLVDRDYRQKIINNLKDPVVKSFWINEYEEWEPRYRNEAIAPVQNKVGQFLNVSFVRNIVGQAKSTIDIDYIMNNQKILLVNVSKGRIGEDNAAILGAMIITKIQLAAMERVRIPEDERKDFYMYVDEFQNFATDSFVNILSEARKYRLDLIIAHQYVGQLTTDTSTAVRDAVFGNVGTMISFRVGAADAEFLEQEFMPEFLQNDLIRLPNYNIYLKLMIDGISSRPFSAKTIAPAPTTKDDKKREEIIRVSRSKYAHSLKAVEEEISRWAANLDVPSNNNVQGPASDLSNPQSPTKPLYKPSNPQVPGSTKLYDAFCSNCGKSTKVTFPPEPGRPVYCKSCLKKLKAGEISPAVLVATAPGLADSKTAAPTRATYNSPSRGNQSEKMPDGNEALEDLGIEFAPPSEEAPKRAPVRTSSRQEKPAASSPSKSQPVREFEARPAKIETISFHSSNRRQGEHGSRNTPPEKQVKRKEINLSELRQALDESLKNISTSVPLGASDQKKPVSDDSNSDAGKDVKAGKNADVLDFKAKNSKEELENRIEEEKYEDEAVEEKVPAAIIPTPLPAKPDKGSEQTPAPSIVEGKKGTAKEVTVAEPKDKPASAKSSVDTKKKIMKPGETVKL